MSHIIPIHEHLNFTPTFSTLPIPDLAASLRDVTNSKRFYWQLAILDHVREGGGVKG